MFKNRKLNLQFHAEEGAGTEQPAPENGASEQGTGTEPQTKTVEELEAEIAKLNALNERYKSAVTKANGEAADYKKRLQSKLTADEQEQELREQEAARVAGLERELSAIKTSKRFMGLDMGEQVAEDAAAALIDGDSDKLFDILTKHIEAVKQGAVQGYLKNRPGINAGNGSAGGTDDDAIKLAKRIAERNKTANADILEKYTIK